MSQFLSDEAIDRIEPSRLYFIFDIILNWVGGIGEVLLLIFIWAWSGQQKFHLFFWLKMGAIAISLLAIREIKDMFAAWLGIAPPDYSLWIGPKQNPACNETMRAIIYEQSRTERILSRGYRRHFT